MLLIIPSEDHSMIKKLDIIDKIIEEKKNKKPDLYKLILLNDDFTTMDFVVKILIMFLNKISSEAQSLMLKVHNEGSVYAVYFDRCCKTIQRKFIIIQTLIINHLNVLLNNYGNFTKSLEKSISNAFAFASKSSICNT